MKNRPALHRLFLASLAMLVLLGAMSLRAAAANLLDEKPRIAVMSAFEPEWTVLKSEIQEPTEYMINGRSFITGKLAGKDVVLFLSGVSMVNAAMNSQIVLDRFSVTALFVSGIAGGVDPELHIGDVVIADQWGEYLEMVFARETPQGFVIPPWMQTEKGNFPGYGMMIPRSVDVTQNGTPLERRFWFATDPGLLDLAKKVAAKAEVADCIAQSQCLHHKPKIVVGGNGVSGSAFVDNAKFREYISATFQAKVVDMESAAVAHVTYSNSVPFLAVRSLSDLAGGNDDPNEMTVFMGLASRNSSTVVKAILQEMP
jgi:adenosylhomocysteine nucleosidase